MNALVAGLVVVYAVGMGWIVWVTRAPRRTM